MLIPTQFLGTRDETTKQLKRAAKHFANGAELDEVFPSHVSTSETDCGIVLTGPHPALSKHKHFHMYSFLRSFLVPPDRGLMKAVWARWTEILHAPWGVLTVLGEHAAPGWRIDSFTAASVTALVRNADELDAMGCRFYSTSPSYRQTIWDAEKNLLAILGAKAQDVQGLDRQKFTSIASRLLV